MRKSLVAVSVMCVCQMAYSAVVPQLYEASVVAQTQSEEEREALLRQGLLQVLEKVSGWYPSELRIPDEKVHPYVLEYRYEGEHLKVQYSPEAVRALLRQNGAPSWGIHRPRVVLWFVLEEGTEARWLQQAREEGALQELLARFEKEHGLPMVLPLFDLEDLGEVDVSAVLDQNLSLLRAASRRYGAEALLLGRIYAKEGERWEAEWRLVENKEAVTRWKGEDLTVLSVIEQGLHEVERYFRGQYGILPHVAHHAQPYWIGVQNVGSDKILRHIETYLQQLEAVRSVALHHIVDGMAIFKVVPASGNGKEALEQVLRMDHQLEILEDNPRLPQQVAARLYRWAPTE